MQHTRMVAIGSGLVLGGIVGAAASATDWWTTPAQAQEPPTNTVTTATKLEPDEREARAKRAIKLANQIAELRAGFERALDQGEEKKANGYEEKLHRVAGQLRELVHALREHDQVDALERIERILSGHARERDEREHDEWEQKEKAAKRHKKQGDDWEKALKTAEKKLRGYHKKLESYEKRYEVAVDRGDEGAARELRAAMDQTRRAIDEMHAYMEKMHAERGAHRERAGDRERDEGPEWRHWGPDRLHGELREAHQHHRELTAKAEDLKAEWAAAKERGDKRAMKEYGGAYEKTLHAQREVGQFIRQLEEEGERRERGEGRERDERRRHRTDGEELEAKFHALGEELDRARRNVNEYEHAIKQARERGEKEREAKLRKGLERLIDHMRGLEENRAEIEAWFERQQDERARDERRNADEYRRRELEQRERRSRERGEREGGSVGDLRRELAGVREELHGLRRQMEEMQEMLAKLLHRGDDERRERDDRRGRDKKRKNIEHGRWPGVPGLPGRSGNRSLETYSKALTSAQGAFQECAAHLKQFGTTDDAISAFNHAHIAYAEAMNTYYGATRTLGEQPLRDSNVELVAHLNRSFEELQRAVDRMADCARDAGRRRAR